ncbi:MAG: hypothetical protein U1E76_08120 [Planctomycetota bacterium]
MPRALEFTAVDGNTHTLAIDQAAKIVCRARADETNDLPRNDVIVLARGDVLTGKLPACTVTIARAPEDVLAPAVVRVAEGCLVAQQNTGIETLSPVWRFGTLDQDELELALDLGPVVKLARAQLDLLLFRRGYVETIGAASELSFTPSGVRARERQRSDGNVIEPSASS